MSLQLRRVLLPCGFTMVIILSLVCLRGANAQAIPHLSDESLLSLLLPPLPSGSRPPVHMWARADQSDGPGGLPTAFLVTLYTDTTGTRPQQREVINYAQFSNGVWAAAGAVQPGTLLTDDWAWVSQHLTNLTAAARGQGNSSQYVVDYEAQGSYNGAPRDIQIEEVYASDLSLISSTILSDTSGGAAATTATPSPTAGPSLTATPGSASGMAAAGTPSAIVAGTTTTAGAAPSTPPASAPNLIRTAAVGASAPAACGTAFAAQGFNWSGSATSLGAISGQEVDVCTGSSTHASPSAGQSAGCILVGDQAATLDGKAACLTFSYIQPQGSGSFLIVQNSGSASANIQPVHWTGSAFVSDQAYMACLGNIAIPIHSADACSSASG